MQTGSRNREMNLIRAGIRICECKCVNQRTSARPELGAPEAVQGVGPIIDDDRSRPAHRSMDRPTTAKVIAAEIMSKFRVVIRTSASKPDEMPTVSILQGDC